MATRGEAQRNHADWYWSVAVVIGVTGAVLPWFFPDASIWVKYPVAVVVSLAIATLFWSCPYEKMRGIRRSLAVIIFIVVACGLCWKLYATEPPSITFSDRFTPSFDMNRHRISLALAIINNGPKEQVRSQPEAAFATAPADADQMLSTVVKMRQDAADRLKGPAFTLDAHSSYWFPIGPLTTTPDRWAKLLSGHLEYFYGALVEVSRYGQTKLFWYCKVSDGPDRIGSPCPMLPGTFESQQ